MEEVEAIVLAASVAPVQRLDSLDRRGQDLGVVRHGFLRRVGEVREEREMDHRIEVAEGLDLEVVEVVLDGLDARDERRDDHHRASLLRHAVLQVEPRQAARSGDSRHDAPA